ncbi:hypothetical protein [Ralstonia solanacearum]|uniref:hypothetical protein n=1 Tax=Ralstonia solanacearum TaxID=305 RepID=UPI00168BFB27|nr:hypothetical protein [Ralstonia solanacearum]QNT25529.1 hypothetical protein C2I38_26095 [Ralstonia solanacearum]QNT63169.1 hypothetical protein C2L97_26085 [Ralstonia solanacearum]
MSDLFSLLNAAAILAGTAANDPSVVGRDKLAAQVLADDLRALRQLALRFTNYVPSSAQA